MLTLEFLLSWLGVNRICDLINHKYSAESATDPAVLPKCRAQHEVNLVVKFADENKNKYTLQLVQRNN